MRGALAAVKIADRRTAQTASFFNLPQSGMIKATLQGPDERPRFLFGLSEINLIRLRKGQPIKIDMRELGLDAEMYIVYGRTEQAIIEDLDAHGLIGPETIQHPSPEFLS